MCVLFLPPLCLLFSLETENKKKHLEQCCSIRTALIRVPFLPSHDEHESDGLMHICFIDVLAQKTRDGCLMTSGDRQGVAKAGRPRYGDSVAVRSVFIWEVQENNCKVGGYVGVAVFQECVQLAPQVIRGRGLVCFGKGM